MGEGFGLRVFVVGGGVWRFGGRGWGRGEGCGIAALTAWLESRERCRDGKGDGCITRRVGNSSLRRGRESCRGDRIMVIRSYLNGPHHISSSCDSLLFSSPLLSSHKLSVHNTHCRPCFRTQDCSKR